MTKKSELDKWYEKYHNLATLFCIKFKIFGYDENHPVRQYWRCLSGNFSKEQFTQLSKLLKKYNAFYMEEWNCIVFMNGPDIDYLDKFYRDFVNARINTKPLGFDIRKPRLIKNLLCLIS